MKVGRRLAIKLLNASKFVLGLGGRRRRRAAAVDRRRSTGRCSAALAAVIDAATAAFERLRLHAGPRAIETFFWSFCDDYVELVKDRAYGDAATGARLGPGRAGASRCRRCCGCSRRSCRS